MFRDPEGNERRELVAASVGRDRRKTIHRTFSRSSHALAQNSMSTLPSNTDVHLDQALLATFPESGAASFTPAEQSVLEASRRRLGSAAFASYQSQLSGSVSLLDVQLEGSPVGVHYTLPHDYPDCAPRIQVHCAAGRYT